MLRAQFKLCVAAQVCSCRRDDEHRGGERYRCGDDCLNRSSHILCDARACPCRGDCTNKQFNLRKAPSVQVQLTADRCARLAPRTARRSCLIDCRRVCDQPATRSARKFAT